MHFPVLVVSQRILLQPFHDLLIGNNNRNFRIGLHHQFQDIQQLAGIPSGITEHGIRLSEFHLLLLHQRIAFQCMPEQFQQILFLQRFQHIKLTAGEQRTNHLKGRILRCCSNQSYHSRFYGSQQRILLRLAETVNFVYK